MSEGDVFYHPRGFTIDRSFAQEFAGIFHDACPLFLSAPYARSCGFEDLLVPPLQVFNIVLSLGVQNNSEKAIANLGYYNVVFLRPVYPGDTLRACTRVLSKRERGEAKPGIVHVQTLGINQKGVCVIQYERKIMLPSRPADYALQSFLSPSEQLFPDTSGASIEIPDLHWDAKFASYTGRRSYFENFQPGMVLLHKNMRTISDEHIGWTYRMGNTHPLHYDRIYSASLSGKMSGEPIVYGGLVFAWLAGLASRDTTENMLWDLGYSEGYHTQPAVSGDTIGALSRVLKTWDGPMERVGIVQLQLIGLKNITPRAALDRYGKDLFMKENDKKKSADKEKIAEKIFEIERKVLLKKHS